ncbi:MAG: T9SS type A sorting domain-containing protein, partial [Saprospiraceae bacterium]
SINSVALAANKIQSNGSEQVLLNGAKWGTWFGTGIRKLTINTKNFAAISSFDISPNPFIETLTLELKGLKSNQLNIQLLNSLGQIVKTENWKIIEGANTKILQLSELGSGVYILNISNQEGSTSTKIVKQ